MRFIATFFKKPLLLLLITLLFLGCKNNDDDGNNNQNPFLNPPIVNLNLNLNLPEYNSLKFPGNSVIISQQGIKGIIIYNVNNSLYTAFDLTDPNHTPNNCSRMEIEGVQATCPCDDGNTYDIITGQNPNNSQAFPMLQYRIRRSGDNIIVTN